MNIDGSKILSNFKNVITWPFKTDDNFYCSTISMIAFFASKKFLTVSNFYSMLLATAVFCSIRIYQNVQIPVSNHDTDRLDGTKSKKDNALKIEIKTQRLYRKIFFRIAAIKMCAKIISDAYMIQEMKHFLVKDYFYMLCVDRRYELDKNKNKINEDKFSKEKEKFISLLKYFQLDNSFIEIWKTWPSIPSAEFLSHCKSRGEYFFNNIFKNN